jgi:hypothetical protein
MAFGLQLFLLRFRTVGSREICCRLRELNDAPCRIRLSRCVIRAHESDLLVTASCFLLREFSHILVRIESLTADIGLQQRCFWKHLSRPDKDMLAVRNHLEILDNQDEYLRSSIMTLLISVAQSFATPIPLSVT